MSSHPRALLVLALALVIGDRLPAQRPDTIVRLAGPPRYPGISTLREEMSIGTVSGAEEYTFGKIFDLALAREGSIYVLDRSINMIRMYDASGKYLRTIGRRGQGPGEMQSPVGMRVLRDGRLLVWDHGNARMNVYTATGSNLPAWPIRPGGSSLVPEYLVTDTMGFVFAKQVELVMVPPDRRVQGQPPADFRFRWLRVRGSDGAVLDSIAEPDLPFPPPFRANASRGWRQMAMPFAAPRIVRMSPLGYLVSGVADRYAFEVSVPGQPIVSIRRDVSPTAVSAKERDEARDKIETSMRQVDPLWTWGGRDLPKVKPYYLDIDVGLDGRIWITREKASPPLIRSPTSAGRSGAGVPMTEAPDPSFVYTPTRFDVFEATGTFIGQVEAPPKVRLLAMRGDYAWGVARDDDDVEFVKRYRIVWK